MDAIASADSRFPIAERIPGDSEIRSKVVEILVIRPPTRGSTHEAYSRIREQRLLYSLANPRNRLEHQTICFGERAQVLIAQTIRNRQIGPEPPRIACVECPVILMEIALICRAWNETG